MRGPVGPAGSRRQRVRQGANLEIPTTMAIPLGFIVNELITNSAKYAEGHVSVRIEATSPTDRSLSVVDDGPGMPAGFKPEDSKGLGMKIVLSLATDRRHVEHPARRQRPRHTLPRQVLMTRSSAGQLQRLKAVRLCGRR